MAITLVSTVGTGSGKDSAATAAKSWASANLLVAVVAYDPAVTIGTGDITNTTGGGNAWQAGAEQTSTGARGRLFWKWGSGLAGASEVITVTKTSGFINLIAYAFTGVQTSSDPKEGENGNQFTGSTVQPGNCPSGGAPAAAGNVFVSGYGSYIDTVASTINSSFSTPDFVAFGASDHYAQCGAYKIQTGGAAQENPTWTNGTGATYQTVVIATFKAGAGGGGTRGLFRPGGSPDGVGIGGSFFRNPLQGRTV